MLFHTHVYYSKRVDQNLDSLKVIGSFLPDLALTGVITWNDLHKRHNILEFFEYVEKNNPEYTSLLKGINYHNTLDYYAHLEYKNLTPGYAYASIPSEMPPLLEKALGVTTERARTSSHNCIECGVEYYLLRDDPDLTKLIKNAIEQIHKEKLTKLLAEFYKKDENVILEALNQLFSFAMDYNLKTLDGWLKLWVELNRFYLKKEADPNLSREVLELSFKTIKDTYREFIEYSIVSQDTAIKDVN